MLPFTKLGHSRQGQPNGGGSEMGKQPLCQDGKPKRSTTLMRNAPTYIREVPTLTMEGWLYTLQSSPSNMTIKQKDRA